MSQQQNPAPIIMMLGKNEQSVSRCQMFESDEVQEERDLLHISIASGNVQLTT